MTSSEQPERRVPLAGAQVTLSRVVNFLQQRLFPKRRFLAQARARWGLPGDKDGWGARNYFGLIRDDAPGHHVDDKSWADLELPALFARMDSTSTPLGNQYLYAMLRTYVEDEAALIGRHSVFQRLRNDTALRESILWALAPLADDVYNDVAEFLFGEPPQRFRYPWLPLAWSALSLAAVLAAILSLVPAWAPVVFVVINAFITFFSYGNLRRDAERCKRCLGMLLLVDRFSEIKIGSVEFPSLGELRKQAPERARVRRKLRLMARLQNEYFQWVAIWLNLAFLFELVVYSREQIVFVEVLPVFQSTWRLLGSIDAAVALASFLEAHPVHCLPRITSRAVIDIQNGYHPLIERPVENSLLLDGRSALVTGSNMAGKTTFIKMVAINIVLGRTLGFCLASRATLPPSSVMASIRNDHAVESGSSHYFAEIETLKGFLRGAGKHGCHVFLVDEIFNGTNTAERIAIARAVLEQLSAHAQVLVTTHDVELQHDLARSFDLYHFGENPEIERFFDYALMHGAATERNAIRLLGRVGFPAEVVARALEYVGGTPAANDSAR